MWTTGLLTYIFDFNKPGLAREIVARLNARDARRGDNRDRFVYEPDEMKVLLEEMCAEAGVKFLLHTRVAAAYREEGRLATIVTESKSGREAWRAPVFIDATGDGDLGARADEETLWGKAAGTELARACRERFVRVRSLAIPIRRSPWPAPESRQPHAVCRVPVSRPGGRAWPHVHANNRPDDRTIAQLFKKCRPFPIPASGRVSV